MVKLTSRKFWGAVIVTLCGLYLAIFQDADAGACAGAIAVAWMGYCVAEGYVDGKREESNQTITTNETSVTATSASQKVVEKAFSSQEAKDEEAA